MCMAEDLCLTVVIPSLTVCEGNVSQEVQIAGLPSSCTSGETVT